MNATNSDDVVAASECSHDKGVKDSKDDSNDGNADEEKEQSLSSAFAEQLVLSSDIGLPEEKDDPSPMLLLCDLGYGIPKETRPRKEKILAIAKQLVNFLSWQQHAAASSSPTLAVAHVVLVDCNDIQVQEALLERMKQVWQKEHSSETTMDFPFPSNIYFAEQSLQEYVSEQQVVYLSPDSDKILDTSGPPPQAIVVGMLIDRRIQVDRSRLRSNDLRIPSARWPALPGLDPKEPFNVDCILEGMQQWEWNYHQFTGANEGANDASACFQTAALQAFRHHQDRHPQRPTHK